MVSVGGVETCGCGGVVPREFGAAHPYMVSAPACWRMFGELGIRVMAVGSAASERSDVDCFAVQHTAGAATDRRQRSSIAVHLVALCARLERGVPPERVQRLRGRVSDTVLPALGMSEWPVLADPAAFGPVTVAGLHALPEQELAEGIAGWPPPVWAAWSTHHQTVRGWTDTLLAAGRRR